ncbi:glycosyltransferase family 39 protein [bacterium]|nr:glycosyltransferase family 39 protein [bacterium]MBU1074249.1 glycosyltransferase family 39 protein [bacterium]MBU1676625.1 glycosyltransferase family 39 protein [bacterium]
MTVKPARRFNWRHPWFISAVVFLLALALRIGHVRQAADSPLMRDSIPMYDSQYYDRTARGIAGGDWLGDEVFYLAPLYPYALAAVYAAAPGDEIAHARYLQCALGAVTCLLICWIAMLSAGPVAGLLAGLIAALYGLFIYYDGILMPSALTLGLHMAATLALLLAARRESRGWWVAGGLAVGLCALAHGTALLFFPGVLVWLWFGFPGSPARARLGRIAIVSVTCVLVVGLVTVRNYAVGWDFVLLTSNAGKNLFIGNNELATGTYGDAATYPYNDIWGSHLGYYLRDEKRTARDMRPSRMSAFFAGKARDYVLQNPGRAVRLWVRKARLCLHATELGINDNFYFARRYSGALRLAGLGFGLVAPIGLVGLVCRGREWRRHLLLIALLVSQFAAFTITFVLGRYRLTLAGVLVVAAALQLCWWGAHLRAQRYRPVLLSLVPLVLLVLVVNLPIEGITRERGFGQQYAQVGEAHLRSGELDRAREAFARAVAADFEPWYGANLQRAECHLQLGRIHEQMRQTGEARQDYRRALAAATAGPLRDPRMIAWLEERLTGDGED